MDIVTVTDLKVHLDDRGYLFEVVHGFELPQITLSSGIFPMFGQVYVVGDPVRGTIRAYHRHEKLWDYFCIVNGSAKFSFVKGTARKSEDYEGRPIIEEHEIVVLNAKTPKMIIVPPGIWHGWMSLEDNTILLSVASELYNKDKPDEERCSPYEFEAWTGPVWKVTAK